MLESAVGHRRSAQVRHALLVGLTWSFFSIGPADVSANPSCSADAALAEVEGCAQGRREDRGACYERAALKTSCGRFYRYACDAYVASGDEHEALRACNLFVHSAGPDEKDSVEAAQEHVERIRRKRSQVALADAEDRLRAGNPYEAVKLFEASRRFFDQPAVAWGLCRAYYQTGDFEAAARECVSFAGNGDEVAAKLDDAKVALERARKAAIAMKEAEAALREKKPQRALEHENFQLLASHPAPTVMLLLCAIYESSWRLDDAEKTCRAARRASVDDEEIAIIDERLTAIADKRQRLAPSAVATTRPWYQDRWAWAAAVGGGAALGASAGMFVRAAQWDDIAGRTNEYSRRVRQAAADTASSLRTGAVVVGLAGAAAFAYGVKRFLDDSPHTERSRPPGGPGGVPAAARRSKVPATGVDWTVHVGPSFVGLAGQF